MVYFGQSGTKFTPKKILGNGGEAEIFAINERNDLLLKIYKKGKVSTKDFEKLKAMVVLGQSQELLRRVLTAPTPTLTWPVEIVYPDVSLENPIGYAMRSLANSGFIPLRTITDFSTHRNDAETSWLSQMGLGRRCHMALNLCRVVGALHDLNIVIGDLNENNVLGGSNSLVSILDCDSMQFVSLDGKQFTTAMHSPSFDAPELSLESLGVVPRTKEEDYFSLSVLIYKLIFGFHPFSFGVPRDTASHEFANETTTQRIKTGDWLGCPNSNYIEPPFQLSVGDFLPPHIFNLFQRSFTPGSDRPSDSEWKNGLIAFLGDWMPSTSAHDVNNGEGLKDCITKPVSHQYPSHLPGCPWCASDNWVKGQMVSLETLTIYS